MTNTECFDSPISHTQGHFQDIQEEETFFGGHVEPEVRTSDYK